MSLSEKAIFPEQSGLFRFKNPKQSWRFWKRINQSGPIPEHCPEVGPCWTWTGGFAFTGGRGIYRFKVDGKNYIIAAHRLSYMFFKGPIKDGMDVCHKCDNEDCVNPDHLWIGTRKENMMDKVAKKRGNFANGGIHYRAKLNEEKVAEIRHRYATECIDQSVLAKEYGIATSGISGIITGKTWKLNFTGKATSAKRLKFYLRSKKSCGIVCSSDAIDWSI
jgi:hypothetical protein